MERKYKESGVAWASQIPSDWKVIRGKNLLKLINRPVRETDEIVTCFRDGEVILRSERRTEGFTMSDKEIGYQGINKGDIVIHGMDGFAGSIGVSKSTGKGSPVLVVCNPKEDDDSRYIVYYLRTLAINNVFLALATGIRERSCDLRWNKISELPFIRPKSDEQKRIANYIDTKIEEIDGLIKLQEQIIVKLSEYKKSVITEAVTKGLNPETQFVPSGIKWISQIPKGWEIVKLRNLGSFTASGIDKKIVDGEELIQIVNYVDVFNNNTKELRTGNYMVVSAPRDKCIEHQLNLGDMIYTPSSETIEDIGLSSVVMDDLPNTAYSYHVIRFRTNRDIFIKYKKYLTNNHLCLNYFSSCAIGSIRKTISREVFKECKVLLPPLDEQRRIAEFLDVKCDEIDRLIASKKKKIETLKEYKKSVIYEAVTGKTICI